MESEMGKRFLCFFVFLFCAVYGVEKKTICLNMIVKNESSVIERSLCSVKPLIDYWVIVDTGSTDGTQKIIQNFMKDIPGKLYERPWVDFAHNRNEALELAKGKGDFVLFIDADEEFIYNKNFVMPSLDLDSYLVTINHAGSRYFRKQLINNHLKWNWVGVLHEYVNSSEAKSQGILKGVTNIYRSEGYRSRDLQKYHKDAKVLEKALEKEPNNSRYVFYLAQSYKDAGDFESALKNYEKRTKMGGWEQEVFWSLYQFAILQETLKMPADVVIKGYCDAYHFRPIRAEPLCKLAIFFRKKGNYLMAYLVARLGIEIPKPKDILMLEEWVYDYWLPMEKAIGAYWVGKYEESYCDAVKLLENSKFPEEMHIYAEDVIKWAKPKISTVVK